MKVNGEIKEVLIKHTQIQQRVKELAKEISADFRGKNLLVVGVLKGAWMYLADLVRQLELNVDVDFIAASSYHGGTKSSGVVELEKTLSADCTGRDVLIVEDILDSGTTLAHLKKLLLEQNAKSVTITSFLSKPSRRVVQVDAKYIGFEIPDKFVVGYGMDYAEKYRGLEDICVLDESVYAKNRR